MCLQHVCSVSCTPCINCYANCGHCHNKKIHQKCLHLQCRAAVCCHVLHRVLHCVCSLYADFWSLPWKTYQSQMSILATIRCNALQCVCAAMRYSVRVCFQYFWPLIFTLINVCITNLYLHLRVALLAATRIALCVDICICVLHCLLQHVLHCVLQRVCALLLPTSSLYLNNRVHYTCTKSSRATACCNACCTVCTTVCSTVLWSLLSSSINCKCQICTSATMCCSACCTVCCTTYCIECCTACCSML